MCSRLATLIMAAFTGVLYVTNAQQTRQCFDHESACVDDKPMFRDSRPCKSLCAQRATERRVTNSAHECGEEKNQCCCYFNPVAKQQQRRENNNKQDDADTAESSDLITGLPGLNFKPNFKQYSGHLDGDNNGTIKLFYWYAQSQNDSKNDPIIFWYNGGPGCSSMEGFLTENGPFHINKKGDELVQNPYSWNQLANLVAIDQPAGTGFSYTTDGKTAFSDETAAQANAHALNEFFKRYPDLIHNDFYLSGESYAGIYIPTTARRIIEAIKAGSFANKNFKGIMMGNGAYDMNVHTSTMVPYLYYHGVLGYELVAAFTKITSVCCGGNMTDGFCDYAKHVVPDIAANFVSDGSECGELVIQAAYDITFNDIQNQYNAYQSCYRPIRHRKYWTRFNRNVFSQLTEVRQNRPDLFSNDAEGGYECYAENSYVKYLNLPEVQTALHIPDDFKSIIGEYQMCSDPVFYDYKQQYVDISEVFKWLLTEQDVPIKILSYHGDADTVCNFIGATVFIHRLVESMSLKPTAARKAWRYLGAIGGFVEEYGERLTFLTVHGAGHMVPTDRPGPALQMITDFILGNSMNKQILRRQ